MFVTLLTRLFLVFKTIAIRLIQLLLATQLEWNLTSQKKLDKCAQSVLV